MEKKVGTRAADNTRISTQGLGACLQESDMFHLISRKTMGQTFFLCLVLILGET